MKNAADTVFSLYLTTSADAPQAERLYLRGYDTAEEAAAWVGELMERVPGIHDAEVDDETGALWFVSRAPSGEVVLTDAHEDCLASGAACSFCEQRADEYAADYAVAYGEAV